MENRQYFQGQADQAKLNCIKAGVFQSLAEKSHQSIERFLLLLHAHIFYSNFIAPCRLNDLDEMYGA